MTTKDSRNDAEALGDPLGGFNKTYARICPAEERFGESAGYI
jgi:hypothetical protein